jgi:hypothetical protein
VGFTVFANQPRTFATEGYRRLPQELFEMLSLSGIVGTDLSLGNSAQEAAARLSRPRGMGIDPLQ